MSPDGGHLPLHRKLRNVQRDPRVSLSIEIGGHNEMGLANYLVVEGYVLRITPQRVRGTNPWTSDEAVEAADRVRSHQPGERFPED